ncbi:MAG: YbhB/YbcL family Raf kinase inhibitor-like protein [Phycisphaerales bacterium]|nr:YbhB/YbcL family Raf kinase inhibitor-like protein [Phycisphaerales bacterium]
MKFYYQILKTVSAFCVIVTMFVVCKKNNTNFSISSATITNLATIKQASQSCGGENISPQLNWKNVPANTKGFVITMINRSNNSSYNWCIFDIPNNVTELLENAGTEGNGIAPPTSIQTVIGAGAIGYVGPCASIGQTNQYEIDIYAVSLASMGLTDNSTPQQVVDSANKYLLAFASFRFNYQGN